MTVIAKRPHYSLPPSGEVAPVPDWNLHKLTLDIYPECEAHPIPESTIQHLWIAILGENLELLFADEPLVFVAADIFWYPVEGQPKINLAPDTMVAFGRPKGHRHSYRQWDEGNIAPQVVFEIRSESNSEREMRQKREAYQRYGVLEYYDYDPESRKRFGWHRADTSTPLQPIPDLSDWFSPILGIRFGETEEGDWCLFHPDGAPFSTFTQLAKQSEADKRMRLIAEEQREAAEAKSEAISRQNARLAERLRALGIDPDTLE